MTEKPQLTPDVVAQFAEYYRRHPAWGCFHIVLDDGNTKDSHVAWCLGRAYSIEEIRLGRLLMAMSRSQRGRLPGKVRALLAPKPPSRGCWKCASEVGCGDMYSGPNLCEAHQ